jgi:hypothetical protein
MNNVFAVVDDERVGTGIDRKAAMLAVCYSTRLIMAFFVNIIGGKIIVRR